MTIPEFDSALKARQRLVMVAWFFCGLSPDPSDAILLIRTDSFAWPTVLNLLIGMSVNCPLPISW